MILVAIVKESNPEDYTNFKECSGLDDAVNFLRANLSNLHPSNGRWAAVVASDVTMEQMLEKGPFADGD